jgi:DNA-binding NtrC family response regulator
VARILLIDDDADLSDYLRDELARRGHEAHCLERAEEAPRVLAEARPPFRLVLLDNKLLGMSGIEFLEALQGHGLKVPVILMTGYATAETAILATKLGAHDYVLKPDSFQSLFGQLAPIIQQCLALTERPPEVSLPLEPAPASAAGPMLVAGPNQLMREVYKLIGQFAPTDRAVLIRGETGTGKELIARAIHTHSARKSNPFLALNCAAVPETLLEDELFGHEKGAFTGAVKLRKGKLEHADGGTMFLDEIGDMALPLQAKLLRVLEYQEFERIGGNEPIRVNVRFVSATHRDLEAAIHEGTFRKDLFFRLNQVTIRLPALRERLDDLPKLAAYFLARAAAEMGRAPPTLADSSLEKLRGYSWPGNIRELQNVLYRALGVCRGPQILPAHVPDFSPENYPSEVAGGLARVIERFFETQPHEVWPLLRDLVEKELLRVALGKLDGNKTQVAERLGIVRNTVIDRMRKYGLQ